MLGKLPVSGRPTIWMIVGQGPIALAVGAGEFFFGHFYSYLSFLSSVSLSFRDGRIRLKYCLKRPSNPKQPTTDFSVPNSASQVSISVYFTYFRKH